MEATDNQARLEIYNTLTKKKEHFEPLTPPHVGLYVCGPTVYLWQWGKQRHPVVYHAIGTTHQLSHRAKYAVFSVRISTINLGFCSLIRIFAGGYA